MELRQLRLFEAASHLHSFTRVAVALDTTPATVSRELSALERDLGGRLFVRTGRGVRLTELGLSLSQEINDLLIRADRLAIAAKGAAGQVSGEVRVGLLPSLARLLGPPLFQEIRKKHAGVRLRLVEGFSGALEEELAAGRLDVAVLQRLGTASRGDERVLTTSRLHLVGSRGVASLKRPEIELSELLSLPLALPALPHMVRHTLEDLAKKRGLKLDIRLTVDSIAILMEVVASGDCVTVLPAYAASAALVPLIIEAIPIVNPAIEMTVVLRSNSEHSGTRAAQVVTQRLGLLAAQLFAPAGSQPKGRWKITS